MVSGGEGVTDGLCQRPALGLERSGQLHETHPSLVVRPLAFRFHFSMGSVPVLFSFLAPCHPTHMWLLRLASKNTASTDRQLATS